MTSQANVLYGNFTTYKFTPGNIAVLKLFVWLAITVTKGRPYDLRANDCQRQSRWLLQALVCLPDSVMHSTARATSGWEHVLFTWIVGMDIDDTECWSSRSVKYKWCSGLCSKKHAFDEGPISATNLQFGRSRPSFIMGIPIPMRLHLILKRSLSCSLVRACVWFFC